jgi:hypothetical protein
LRPVVTINDASDLLPPTGLHVEPSSWRLFTISDTDALLVGEDPAIWRAVCAVWPTLRKPRFWCDGRHQRPSFPLYRDGTLILQHVLDLNSDDQQALLAWCERVDARSRLVATASEPFRTRVEVGLGERLHNSFLQMVQVLLT